MKMTHKEKQKWYGFTEDQVFGVVMSNKRICEYIIQIILDENIEELDMPETQKQFNDPSHRKQKDIRMDVFVENVSHTHLYDVEMQRGDNENLGRRLRYYAAKMDQRQTLKKGQSYQDLRDAHLIFLCSFDPGKEGKIKYVSRDRFSDDQSSELNDGLKEIIINAKGIPDGTESPELLALVDLMNDKPVHLNPIFDEIQKIVKYMNGSPKWRDAIMNYEDKMAEAKARGERKANISDAKIAINRYLQLGFTKEKILPMLQEDYANKISPNEITELVSQA